jgi:putative sigma-54 modulation protein
LVKATKEALMRIEIKARKVAVTDDLRQRVDKRFDKIAKQVSPLAELEVELSEDTNPRISNSQICEATLRLKGTTLRAKKAAPTMVTAVNGSSEDLARQVKKLKAKRSHRRDATPDVSAVDVAM